MSENAFQIQPSPIYIDHFSIGSVISRFNESALITVNLISGDQMISSKTLEISGQDYQAWTQDNPYLLNWICGQLGFTLLS
jgi:hypothetical protein